MAKGAQAETVKTQHKSTSGIVTPGTQPVNGENGAHASSRAGAGGGGVDTGVKHFVLDTNVLLHNPDALFVFNEHHIIVPFAVIEELDKMKRKDDDLGRNARACIRHLDRLRIIGRLSDGVDWGKLGAIAGTAISTGANGQTGSDRKSVV